RVTGLDDPLSQHRHRLSLLRGVGLMPTIDGPRLEDSVSPVKTFPENFSPPSVNARYFAWLRAKFLDVRRGALGQIGQDPLPSFSSADASLSSPSRYSPGFLVPAPLHGATEPAWRPGVVDIWWIGRRGERRDGRGGAKKA